MSLDANAQTNCIKDSTRPQKLQLDGNNFTLIDNALRCFKLNSVNSMPDTLIRVWLLDVDDMYSPSTWRVRMFEFGKKRRDIPFARLYSLEWGFDERDSSLPVKCIQEIRAYPDEGWPRFEKDISRINLQKLYKEPFLNKGIVNVDFGMMIFQFMDGYTTHTVDFTGLLNISNDRDPLQIEQSKRVVYLLWYIEKHFLLNLTDWEGRDYLKSIKEQLNMK